MRPERSLGAEYFRRIYAREPDPWRFATSDYERQKYALTLEVLPRPCYAYGFEIGCSIGVMTRMLAGRCERLLAIDLLDEVVERARERCADQPHVELKRMRVPDELPTGMFDLIVLAEVGYYLNLGDLDRLLAFTVDRLEPGGHLIAVHWTSSETDHPLTGNQVHERIVARRHAWRHLHAERRPGYRLDLLERQSGG